MKLLIEKMKQKKFWVGSILGLILIFCGGLLFIWVNWEQSSQNNTTDTPISRFSQKDYDNLLEDGERHSLLGAYAKNGNLWLKNFITGKDAQVTNIKYVQLNKKLEPVIKEIISTEISEKNEFKYAQKINAAAKKKPAWRKENIENPVVDYLLQYEDKRFVCDFAWSASQWLPSNQGIIFLKALFRNNNCHSNKAFVFEFASGKELPFGNFVVSSGLRDTYVSPNGRRIVKTYKTHSKNNVSKIELIDLDIDYKRVNKQIIFEGLPGIGRISDVKWLADNKTIIALYDKSTGYGTGGVDKNTFSVLAINVDNSISNELFSYDRDKCRFNGGIVLSPDNKQIAYFIRTDIGDNVNKHSVYLYNFENKKNTEIHSFVAHNFDKINGRCPSALNWFSDNSAVAILLSSCSGAKTPVDNLLVLSLGEEIKTAISAIKIIDTEGSYPALKMRRLFLLSPDNKKIAITNDKNELWLFDIQNESSILLERNIPLDTKLSWIGK